MQVRAAVLWGLHQEWQVEDIEVDPPKPKEVLVKWEAAGMCHSDEHMVTGDMVTPEEVTKSMGLPPTFPIICGHEGAGVVVEVGEGVTAFAPGDHVAASFVPACGVCRWCTTGKSALCDFGVRTFIPGQIADGTSRHRCNGHELNLLAKLGTFAEHTVVHELSLIKIDPSISLTAAALVSCGVATGWGSAVHRAEVKPGDVVVVIGVGGIGINAVQGARMAGARAIIGVDPVEFKQKAALDFGATHAVGTVEEAQTILNELTWGENADKVILTPSVLYGDILGQGLSLTGKGGTVVATAIAPMTQTTANISLFELAMWNKEVKGVIFGSGNPRFDIPMLLKLYQNGQLKLDELVTRTYTLDQINEGYQDLRDGKNIRGVITYS